MLVPNKNIHCVPGESILFQKYAFIKKIHNEDLILTKFRNDWIKIVDFLIKAYF